MSATSQSTQPQGDGDLVNQDLLPTAQSDRHWDWKAIAALWVGMVVCVPAYMLAAGLISEGMSWNEAVFTVFLANVIVLVPMLLIGHAGTKHGIPFPVLLRASFGTRGAKLPAVLRGLVACGWFGIQTWVGGAAIYTIVNVLSDNAIAGSKLPLLGIDIGQTLCFLAFWALHVLFIRQGTESIRWLELLAAPLLILMCLGLLLWAYIAADGFGPMLSAPSQFAAGGPREGQFASVFWPSLTAMVGFWATLALNIPDFTRYAKSQRDQMLGQMIGLPIPMALLAFIGVAVTSATVLIYGEAIWDPVALAGRLGGVGVVIALLALVLATLTTNLAANVVAPANGFSNLAPGKISFRMGGYITAGIGIAIFPWKLLETTGAYIFTWLIGYSALLGPIAGIMLVDYYLIRRTELDRDGLFNHRGPYGYRGGWNLIALLALVAGVLPNLPGFLKAAGFVASVPTVFETIYAYAWFVGLLVAGSLYYLLSPRSR
ncbi:NCS1 family nucleobase:cation symporter-1 [Pseudomarimonas arenosa]|uniref:NCS1 family nucleobase:cation symporter-1 n=1 Tax=Pseudomarimonas arenosa TaxID=2774145 RepID=A0AAW3ZLF0_9GAMM|nr:NCS1 family nucleobase:cation symporter-1 [Pseudomarimonas arenosa]MBD8526568.1 NCS1 family nucleobase:cation symporter-1 [Pseudomarimonas arenosa]